MRRSRRHDLRSDERNSISTISANRGQLPRLYYCQPRRFPWCGLRHGKTCWATNSHGVLSGAEHPLLHTCVLQSGNAFSRTATEILASQDLSDLSANGPWIVLFLATLFLFRAIVVRGNVMLPYSASCQETSIFFCGSTALAWLRCWWASPSRPQSQATGQAVSVYRQHDAFGLIGAALFAFRRNDPISDHRGRGLRQFFFGLSGR